MKLIKSNIEDLENNPVMLYKMTRGKNTVSVNKMDDDQLDRDYAVMGYALYEDVNSKGEDVEILSVLTEGGLILAAQSKTFKESFFDILDIVNGKNFSIKVDSGTSKSGRRYMDCELTAIE